MHFLTIGPFFFALGLSLMSMGSDCVNFEPNSTLATFGPSIEQVSTTLISSESAFQQFTTSVTAESIPSSGKTLTNTEQISKTTMFGISINQTSSSSAGTTTQQITTRTTSPSQTEVANSSSTIEAIIQIHISDFVGMATVNLTKIDPSSTTFNMESSSTSISVTKTQGGLYSTMASGTKAVPSHGYNSSSTSPPLSNWTAGYNTTNGSFASLLSPSPTALTVFTGQGTLHRHIGMPGMAPLILFQIAVISLV
jgi:hypothetical protein